MWRDPWARGTRAVIFRRCAGLLFCCSLAWLLCSAAPAHAQVFRLPDTGQTTCYQDGFLPAIPCAGTGQDGEYIQNPLSYTDNKDGTVTDNETGLMWQQEDDGATYNWYRASGTDDAVYNPESADVCGSLSLGFFSIGGFPQRENSCVLSITGLLIQGRR